MKRDWIWGIVSFPLAGLVSLFVVLRSGLLHDRDSAMLAVLLTIPMIVSSIVLYLMNRRSIRKLRAAGKAAELVIRPAPAIARAAILFPTIIGVYVLIALVIGRKMDWEQMLLHSAVFAWVFGITQTAYRR